MMLLNRSPVNRPPISKLRVVLKGVYHVITHHEIASKYTIRLVGSIFEGVYRIQTSCGITGVWHIHIGTTVSSLYRNCVAKLLNGVYHVRLHIERDALYHIHTKSLTHSLYSIINPTIRFDAVYSIPFREDAIFLGMYELLGAVDEDSGSDDFSPITRERDDGSRIIIPPKCVGYSNTFEGFVLSMVDIKYIRETLMKGWFNLTVYDAVYENCVVTSFKHHRDADCDYWYYQLGVAQDTRMLSSQTLTYGGIPVSNFVLDGNIDPNLKVTETTLLNECNWIESTSKPNWSLGFSCITDNITEIPTLVKMFNKTLPLVYNGETYDKMKITAFSLGKKYTGVYKHGQEVVMQEYFIRFGQNSGGA